MLHPAFWHDRSLPTGQFPLLMSLSVESSKGIHLKLDRYSPIRSWQVNGRFWEPDFQAVIRQGRLADFLPSAAEENGGVFYEQMIAGREALSESEALGSLAEAPASEVEALRAALAELRARAADPACDPTQRRIIDAFRLPDPARDAELYRVYGAGAGRRLLVLWGVEKEAGSALQTLPPLPLPVPVPARLAPPTPVTAGAAPYNRWLWLLLLVPLAALAAGGWYLFHALPPFPRLAQHRAGGFNAVAPRVVTPPPVSPLAATPLPKPADARQVPAPPPASASPSAANVSPSPRAAARPGGSPTPLPAAGAPSNGTDELYSAPPGTMNVQEEEIATPPLTSRPRLAPPVVPGAPPAPTASPAPGGTPPAAGSAPLAPSLEIASAKAASAPKNGRMEVVLNAAAHDTKGSAAGQPRITAWRIDGVVQKGVDGRPFTGPSLPATLARGTHRVSLTGTMPDGSQANAEADVNVSVKVTEEGSIEVTPVRR